MDGLLPLGDYASIENFIKTQMLNLKNLAESKMLIGL